MSTLTLIKRQNHIQTRCLIINNIWRRAGASIDRSYATKQQSKPWKQKPNRNPRLSIILTQDMKNLGVKGQIVKVKRGHGRNILLPKKKAVYKTPDNIKALNAFEVEKGAEKMDDVDFLVNFLKDKTLTVRHDPRDESALFEQHISLAFQRVLQLHVPLDCIELDDPITDFGTEHMVGVRLNDLTVVKVPVRVDRTLTDKQQRRIAQVQRYLKMMSSKAKLTESA